MKEKDKVFIGTIFFVMLVSFKLVQAQETITEIRFESLTHTKTSFLQKYVTSKVGELYDSAILKQDEQRLLNLGILAEVKTAIKYDGQGVVLFAVSVPAVGAPLQGIPGVMFIL